jgi:hypothetical protein
MTESEWLARTNPDPMLQFLCATASARKLRLFACACVRRVWRYLTDDRSRQAVEIAERFADRLATSKQLAKARQQAAWAAAWAGQGDAAEAAAWSAAGTDETGWAQIVAARAGLAERVNEVQQVPQCELLRDIFGNPFREGGVEPRWLSRKLLKLSSSMYDARSFDRMPELGDLLERAGCSDADLLGHCRFPGEHVRGCWVVDLLLGKK